MFIKDNHNEGLEKNVSIGVNFDFNDTCITSQLVEYLCTSPGCMSGLTAYSSALIAILPR